MRAITYYHKTIRAAAWVAIAVGALMATVAARAQEGWDPLKQVTSQISHPNLMVVLDVSGSMAYSPVQDTTVGVDSFGLPDLSWTTTGPVISSSGCTSGKKTYKWTFTLKRTDTPYCRMDAFKNALGNSVPLYGSLSGTTWTGPTITWPATWPYNYTGYVYTGGGVWTWTSACTGSQPSTPSSPFTPSWTVPDYSQSPPVTAKVNCGTGRTCEPASISPITLPQDVVGMNKDKVNWGFEIFSTGFSFKDYTNTTATRDAHILVMAKADDTPGTQANIVALIEPYLKPKALGGLNAYNSTATSYALNRAKFALNYTYTHAGTNGSSNDPQALCGRVYGTVLVTDGASNSCNPSGGYQSCGSGAPSTWKSYPEGRSNELFLEQKDTTSGCTTSDQTSIPSRTFVIGVSTTVSVCELNLDAFMGRTDASSPNGDAGMAIDKDYTGSSAYRLPTNVSTDFKNIYYSNRGITFPAALTVNTTTGTGNYRTTGGDYAYFATSASALYDAFVAIIGAAGAGDYSMSAPVVSGNVVNSGSTAYVSSMTYPSMQGHIYAYDLSQCNTLHCTLPSPTCDSCTGTAANPVPAPLTPVLLWDAGQLLENRTVGADHTSGRSIWTWNPSTKALVEVMASNLTNLKAINSNITANIVDFIRGNNGSGTKRAWLLGPIINSTAAVVSAPQWWTGKSALPSHLAFEQLYTNNHAVLMAGSSDGMMHFFDVADGAEVLALLPPDQLAHEVTLYNNYTSGGATATGEPKDLSQHVFGVASSPRFADVYNADASDQEYHTELLLTEGPGGRALSAIDITHPYPVRTGVNVPYVDGKDPTTQVPILKTKTEDFNADKNYDAAAPVSVLWHKDGAFNYSSLGQTWSVPAVGCTAFDATNPDFRVVLGSGYSATATPALLLLDAVTGGEKVNYSLSSASGLVHNQAYGAGVLFNKTAAKNLPDDALTLGLVSDAYGNVYGVDPVAATAAQLFSADAVNHYPLYYTPAVGYYASWDIYAYATGNFYEKSTAITGANTAFEPYVYIRLKDPLGLQSDKWASFNISSFQYCTANCDTTTPTMKYVPKSAQITADPILFLPANSTPDPTKPVLAYFTFYDPNQALGCGGMSFLVKVSLDMSKLTSGLPASLTTTSTSLGTGAASGISFSGGQVIVAKSAPGQGSAGVNSTGEKGPDVLAQAPQITSWKELQ